MINVWAAIKGVFGVPRAVDAGIEIAQKATDGVIKGIDAAWFTPEEKAVAGKEVLDTVLKFWQQFGAENSQQSIARRTMAFAFVGLFIAVVLVGVVMVFMGRADMVNVMIDFLSAVGFDWIIFSVVATYFVPYQVAKIWTANGKEKENKK